MANLVSILRDRVRMLKDDAVAIAHVVEAAFKGADELDDAMLDKDVRQVFYDLEEMNVLRVRRQEYVEDGQALRGYYWHVQEKTVPTNPVHAIPSDPDTLLYQALQDDAWKRRTPE